MPPTVKKLNLTVRKNSHYFKYFCENYERVKASVNAFFDAMSSTTEFVLYGSGHHAVSFVFSYGLLGKVSHVVDDDVRRRGFMLPGTTLAIEEADAYISSRGNAKHVIFLLAISQVNQKAVILKLEKSKMVRCKYTVMPVFNILEKIKDYQND